MPATDPQRPALRLVTEDERADLSPDPVDDFYLDDFVSVSERGAEVNAMFIAAFDSPEAQLNPWPDPEVDAGPESNQPS